MIIQAASADDSIHQRIDYRMDPTARDVLRLESRAGGRIAVGDRVAVFVERELVAAGTVWKIEAGTALATLEFLEWSLSEHGQALLIAGNLPDRFQPRLPPFVIYQKRSDRAPGIDKTHDPVRAGPYRPVDPASVLTRVVRLGRIDAAPDANGLGLANPASTPLGIGDRLDLYRGTQYVGFAKVVSIDGPEAGAEVLASLSASAVRTGDLAVRRPPAGLGRVRRGFVFRVEGEYALVSLGEADGVRRGDRLFVRDTEGRDRRLTVERVYPDHCGAGLEAGDTDDAGGLTVWQPVTLNEAGPAFVELSVDHAQRAGVSWLFLVPAGPQIKQVREGDFVFFRGRLGGLGVVLTAGEWGAYVYVPGVWTVIEGEWVWHDDRSEL